MTNDELLDLYSDYLSSAFGQTTAPGWAAVLNGQISHDRVQRWLASPARTSQDVWRVAKPPVRAMEGLEGVLIVDDRIAEKPDTDENDSVGWHSDPTPGRSVKGINCMTTRYPCAGVAWPVGVTLIAKIEPDLDPQAGQDKRRSPVGKNEPDRQRLTPAGVNQIVFT